MRIKPILFNTDMVRAILDGRKTATRRLPSKRIRDKWFEYDEWASAVSFAGCSRSNEKKFYEAHPPYQVGDVLYVRETWAQFDRNAFDNYLDYPSSGLWTAYKADGELRCSLCESAGELSGSEKIKWKSSIHMPKEAARIFLKVTDVRVERLQDITTDGMLQEGIEFNPGNEKVIHDDFHNLWVSTIPKQDLDTYGWDANPWVWVIEFERCEKPESEGI